MDLNSLTAAIGRSWVGTVCQKVEGVFQEMDAVVKQNDINQVAEQGQAMNERVKKLSDEVTDEVHSLKSCLLSEDRLLDNDISTSTCSSNVEEMLTEVEYSPLSVDETPFGSASSLTDVEDRPVQVDESIVDLVGTPLVDNPEQLEAEFIVPGKDNSDPESSGHDALNLLGALASADESASQWDNMWEFDLEFENSRDGEFACESHLSTAVHEHPVEETESAICQGIDSVMAGSVGVIVGKNAVDEEPAASDFKSTPSIAEELSDACDCIKPVTDSSENARGSEAKLSEAISVHGIEGLIFSHEETDRATVSEQSSVACSEDKSSNMGLERFSCPPQSQSTSNSGSLLDSFSGESSSSHTSFCAKGCDRDSVSHVPPAPLSTTDGSGYDLVGLNMETVALTDEKEEFEGTIDIKELYALSQRVQNFRSFKEKLRKAFTQKKQLAKEYKHLGILHGDIDIRLVKESQPTPPTSASSDTKRPQEHKLNDESDWVLL